MVSDDEFEDHEERLALHGDGPGDDLLAAVLADPDSDGPRLVYGDYLLERGDPRGEYIQLQLEQDRLQTHDEARSQRMRELATDRMAAWCAPLYPALDKSAVWFRRGFLWHCRALDRTIALRDVIGHPIWRTVGKLESTDETLVGHACVRSMRWLRTSPQALGRLAVAEHESRLERVVVQGVGPFRSYTDSHWRSHREELSWERIQAGGVGLRNLRTCELYNELDPLSPHTAELLDSPFGRQLDSLEYWVARGSLASWVSVLAERPGLRRLAVHTGQATVYRHSGHRCTVVLERDDSGQLRVVLELVGHRGHDDAFATAGSLAMEFPSIELAIDAPDLEGELDEARARLRAFREITVRVL